MNIFRFELKAQWKHFLIWLISLIALYLLFMTIFYGSFMDSKAAVTGALGNLPPAFSEAFGVDVDTIFSFGGFFQFVYTYISLVGAIMAASFGLAAFSREKRSKCVDFLLVKPVGRGRIFLEKLLACLALIFCTNLLFIVVAIFTYSANHEAVVDMGTLILASLSLFFMQLVFLAIAMVWATAVPKLRSVSGAATSIGFAGFIMMALCSIIKEDFLWYVSLLTYFSPGTVFISGGYEWKYVVTAVIVVVACVAVSFWKYCKSDTRAI